ncbi:MAG: DUF1624 domain-containing protein [Bacteroidetes bacterium]|nr:DUF1624 domain-containing protein [Bacteroidota bacterium]
MTVSATPKIRIQSIDILRGMAMVIMALDHVRDFFHRADLGKAADAALNPTNMETTYPLLFFTRWITHFCAPIFVFLAGTSIYLVSQRKSKSELSAFLFKRGLWLLILEVTIVTLGWTYNPFYNVIILQVIWAIGISMIILGLLIHLPYKLIFTIGLIIVVGHNLMDFPAIASTLHGGTLSELIYFADFSIINFAPNHVAIIVYSFLPWTGVMLLGFCFGKLFEKGVESQQRINTLHRLGWSALFLFVLLRLVNFYGDPVPWASQSRGAVYTFLSFLNVNKYPPSLLFLCLTLGAGMIALALIERIQNKFTGVMAVFGRVAMLYYVLHLYLIHLLGVAVFYAQGFGNADISSPNNPFFFKPNGFGFGLLGVYLVWIVVVVLLFPVCKKYDAYKTTHQKWWLSYL